MLSQYSRSTLSLNAAPQAALVSQTAALIFCFQLVDSSISSDLHRSNWATVAVSTLLSPKSLSSPSSRVDCKSRMHNVPTPAASPQRLQTALPPRLTEATRFTLSAYLGEVRGLTLSWSSFVGLFGYLTRVRRRRGCGLARPCGFLLLFSNVLYLRLSVSRFDFRSALSDLLTDVNCSICFQITGFHRR